MEMRLLKNGHTEIKISLNRLHAYETWIQAYIAVYGEKETKRSNRYAYYIVYADVLNHAGRP